MFAVDAVSYSVHTLTPAGKIAVAALMVLIIGAIFFALRRK